MHRLAYLSLVVVCMRGFAGPVFQDSSRWTGDAEKLLDVTVADDAEKERLRWLMENPFDLNSVTVRQLQLIPGVTPSEAISVIRLREYLHSLKSVYQIRSVPRGGELIEKIAPFVTVHAIPDHHRNSINVRTRVSWTYDSLSQHAGASHYGRVTFDQEDINGSILAEKDAGERIADGFASGFLEYHDRSSGFRVTGGDFTAEAGQGLVLWPGLSIGKGGTGISSAVKKGPGIRGYRSSNEFNFFRGLGVHGTVPTRGGELTVFGFASVRSLSGRVGEGGDLTSFYESGLYRSEAERGLRHAVREICIGGRLELSSWDGWTIGVTGYSARFSKPLNSNRTFEFNGNSVVVGGADLSCEIGNILLFAEAAHSVGGAVVGGMILQTGRTNIALALRCYDPRFVALHANGFGENGLTRNEKGIYLGFRTRAWRPLTVSFFVDVFAFPWRTYFNPLPTSGWELFGEATVRCSPSLSVSMRYRIKNTERSLSVTDVYGRTTIRLVGQPREQGRISFDLSITPWFTARSRLAVSSSSAGVFSSQESGLLLYQDIAFRFARRISLRCRLTFFDTDSFDTAFYEYESTVRGQYSFSSLSGRGERWYAVLELTPFPSFAISAKYAQTETESTLRSAFSLQVDLRL